jgi:hypothetical protein
MCGVCIATVQDKIKIKTRAPLAREEKADRGFRR